MTGADLVAAPALILLLVALVLGVHRGLVSLRRRGRVPYPERPSRQRLRATAWVALGTVVVLVVATALPLTLLRWVPPLGTTFMAGRLPHCERVEYLWVPWERISPAVGISVVAAEDQRFPQHNGFDLEAIERALEEAERGRRLRGASTISQQVAKNLFLWPGRSFVRKGLEAWITSWIELLWPKRRILEVYVNVAQFGPCTFGVEVAGWRFFGKHAEDLSSWEAALLAAVLPSPNRFRANAPSRYVAGRAAWIRRQVAQLGGPAYLGFWKEEK